MSVISYLGFAAKSLLVGLGVRSQESGDSETPRGSQNNRMTWRAWKRNPLRSSVSCTFWAKKVPKPFSSKASSNFQPALFIYQLCQETPRLRVRS
ncbi:MAG: hypothetical protein EWV61_08495 [Microcystis aeruginosa Ma_AC_P_19900807_S300]|nr:MAG: hypothetical protein EWV61_08495 [Microcystis aeruginosa Ma_AC_P_19900807_S300]